MVIGEDDDEFSSSHLQADYRRIVSEYRRAGVPDADMDYCITCEVEPGEYFGEYADNQHGIGSYFFPWDPDFMGWLFEH